MLDRMEAANLIYRDRGDKDRRKILIFLTDEAKGLEQEYNEVSEEIGRIYYKGFSQDEILFLRHEVKRTCVIGNERRYGQLCGCHETAGCRL